MEYKTFDDLEFNLHPFAATYIYGCEDAKQARLEFQNGFGVSVVFGRMFYSNGEDTYEVACTKNGFVAYPDDTSFADDVCGYCTKERVTELMKEIQDLQQ